MPRDKNPALVEGSEVGAVFDSVVDDIRARLNDGGNETMVVDVELRFSRLIVKRGGVPVFAPKTKQSSLEIRLATRIQAE